MSAASGRKPWCGAQRDARLPSALQWRLMTTWDCLLVSEIVSDGCGFALFRGQETLYHNFLDGYAIPIFRKSYAAAIRQNTKSWN